ncbi:hypothetical protein CMK12_11450 [Candidatus Poribacteria bacterium]|jgi:L-fuconolactonase|nr:hypothetical protein [Candidatus Poribacteria bacterium]MDP6597659.1 amidohydrolase family protein [Candidatus Poribacteria bacterium]MDP6749316.1 amidohydrolase family protein [Candidatus Poribacteria bacterium]MDP6996783.1 amidohydrolase family protein [Candidatus Poribacteria bacterium]
MIVDTHCHTGLDKYEPIESLLFHLDSSGVDKAVLIQHAGNTDNSYHLQCLNNYPGRFASAMIVADNDDGTQIRSWAEQGILGIRLRADSRADTADPLAHWRVADELGLIVSAPCSPEILLGMAFQEVLSTFPDLQIVLEHLAGASQQMEPPYTVFQSVLKLAEHPTLSIKLPGFGEFCPLPYPFTQVRPLAEMALEAFGPKRMMWGSDYPPVSSREGYRHSLEFPRQYLSSLSQGEQDWIFGRTAASIWRMI